VERDDLLAKFWLEPEVMLEDGGGFNRRELRDIERIIRQRKEELIHEWDDFCSQIR
jgi:hypothetical protein